MPSDSTQEGGRVGLQEQNMADASVNLSPGIVDQNNTHTAFSDCQKYLAASFGESRGYLRGNTSSHDEPTVLLTPLLLNKALAPPFEECNSEDLPASFREPDISLTSIRDQRPAADASHGSSEISFYYYPFLRITNLHQLPQHDAVYLESQGCFKIPTRPFLDEIVRHYFLHIHPFLPLLNEGDFWKLYYYDPHCPPEETISVLLLQAMIFASCTFVSEHTSNALGYRDIRSMRATFLRRAKSLYSLECESSPVTIAQACILLSFTSLSSSRTPNTFWLSVAIENAKLAEAHTHATMRSQSHTKQQNILKRLWWCCIIRDRSMSLLMRLPIRITKDQFDFDDLLTSEDLEDELHRSMVYDPTTKLRLAEILSLSIDLYKTLTDILLFIIPGKSMQCSLPQNEHRARDRVQDCKTSLEAWHVSTTSKLQSTQTNHDPRKDTNSHQSDGHASIILYTNLMYMYYHAARIALCHHEALHLDLLRTSSEPSSSLAKDLSTIYETKHELQDAVSSLAACHEELLRLGLVQWLPSSAIGFILLPLVLNILGTKLLPPPGVEVDWIQAAGTTQQHLNILIQIVRVYRHRYDGMEWASEIVRHAVNLARLDEIKVQRRNSSTTMNWVDIFAFQPRFYLRLVLALDLGLRTGRLPEDWDFPDKLRGLFTRNTNPLKAFVEGTSISRGLEITTIPSPRLQPMSPELSQVVENHNTQYYALGLDECLIASLEGPFTLNEYM
ncbi:hypothetical protein BFJ71_g15201 [Fusarium oxysporum]|nr:hypothetical protein BFJ71_g15201 [Fusarium oxysporum]